MDVMIKEPNPNTKGLESEATYIKMLNCSSLNKYILLLVSPSMPVSLDWNLDVESLMCDCCWCC